MKHSFSSGPKILEEKKFLQIYYAYNYVTALAVKDIKYILIPKAFIVVCRHCIIFISPQIIVSQGSKVIKNRNLHS
jgi:hypothetical protein